MNGPKFFNGKVSNVSVVMSKTHPRPFRTISTTPGRFSIFLSFQKKHFFGGILLASESAYLRVVNFTTILGMFLIYNGKFILDIFNKNQISIKIVCKELGPLAGCSTQNSFNCSFANIGDISMVHICFLLLLM